MIHFNIISCQCRGLPSATFPSVFLTKIVSIPFFSYVYNMVTPSHDIKACSSKHTLRIISLLSLTLAATSAVKTVFSISRTASVSSNPVWNLNDSPRFYVLCCVGKGLAVIRLQAQGVYQFLKHSRFQKFTEMLQVRRLYEKSFSILFSGVNNI